jgi:hypothetical protein
MLSAFSCLTAFPCLTTVRLYAATRSDLHARPVEYVHWYYQFGSDRRPESVYCYTRTCGCLLATLKPYHLLPIPLIPSTFSTQSRQNIPNSGQPPIRSRPLPYRHHDDRRNKYLCICPTIHSHEAVRTARRVDPTSARSSHLILLKRSLWLRGTAVGMTFVATVAMERWHRSKNC